MSFQTSLSTFNVSFPFIDQRFLFIFRTFSLIGSKFIFKYFVIKKREKKKTEATKATKSYHKNFIRCTKKFTAVI